MSIPKADEILPKSKQVFSREDFNQVMSLSLKRPWLQSSSDALYELWFQAENVIQKALLEKLLLQFLYLSDSDLRNVCEKMAIQIQEKWNLLPNHTIVIASSDGKEPDGSQLLIQRLKNKFGINWSESNFLSHFSYFEDRIIDSLNVVVVDDFIGTGKTISQRINFLKSIVDRNKRVNIQFFLLTAAAMEFSKRRLDELSITYFSAHWLRRGITETFEGKDKEDAIVEMLNLEKKLHPKWDRLKIPSFGFGSSESLFSNGDSNVPNNVFPIFWWPLDHLGNERARLFRRVSQRK